MSKTHGDTLGEAFSRLNSSIKRATETINRLGRERDQLAKWKEESLAVEAEWDVQAVSKLLDIPLGQSVRAGIQPAIERLIRERDEAGENNGRNAAMLTRTLIERDRAIGQRDRLLEALEKMEKRFAIKCEATCMFSDDLDAIVNARAAIAAVDRSCPESKPK